jgi:hypothetical protein
MGFSPIMDVSIFEVFILMSKYFYGIMLKNEKTLCYYKKAFYIYIGFYEESS